ncbi:MAG: DUF1566 domain-containing protein [Thiolinea sp.]
MKLKLFGKKQLTGLLLACSLLPTIVDAQICNPSALVTTPSTRFIDNNDGVIIDTKTNLMWQKCTDGQSGDNCSTGSATSYSWQQALQRVDNLNNTSGFSNYVDWRLPNAKELLSLMERSCIEPAINLQVFPNINGSNSDLWSSTPYLQAPNSNERALVAGFSGLGGIIDTMKIYNRAIRLVRNATPTPNIGAY